MVVTRSGKGSRSSPSADRQRREMEISSLGGDSAADMSVPVETTADMSEPVTTGADKPKPVATSSNPTTSGTDTTSYETTTASTSNPTTSGTLMTSSYEYTDATVAEKPGTTKPPSGTPPDGRSVPAAHSDAVQHQSTEGAHSLPLPAPTVNVAPRSQRGGAPSVHTVNVASRSLRGKPPSVHLTASTRTKRSRKSQKIKELAREREELLQLQIEQRMARIARIEAENSESDEDTVISEIESQHRVADWVRQSQRQQLQPVEEPPMKRIEPIKPIASKQQPMEYLPTAPALQKIPVSAPAGDQPIAVKQQTLDITELAQAITLAAQSARPIARNFTELQQYSGSHQEWLSFKAAYVATAPSYTDVENLARLRKALRGTAREAVENLLMYNAQPADVMKALESRFGRPDAIAQVELDRLRALPRLTDAAREVCVFSTKVNNIVAALRALKKQHYLYSPEVTKATIDKFTPALRYRWYDFAAVQPEEEADLIKIARFLEREAERCGPYAQPEQVTAQPLRTNTGAAAAFPARRPQKTYVANTEKSVCPLCEKEGHTSVTKCPQYIAANVDNRWDTAKKKSLCFRCLKRRTQKHTCNQTKCNVDGCNRTHHPMLHFVKKENTEEIETKEVVGTA